MTTSKKSLLKPGNMEAKNKCYSNIEMELGRWENMKYLADMDVAGAEYLGPPDGVSDSINLDYYMNVKKARGMKALQNLVGLYVPDGLVEAAFQHVVNMYEAGWAAYEYDKSIGRVEVGTDDYRRYSWRGIGPKPYFEEIMENFMQAAAKRKYRSIDDE